MICNMLSCGSRKHAQETWQNVRAAVGGLPGQGLITDDEEIALHRSWTFHSKINSDVIRQNTCQKSNFIDLILRKSQNIEPPGRLPWLLFNLRIMPHEWAAPFLKALGREHMQL